MPSGTLPEFQVVVYGAEEITDPISVGVEVAYLNCTYDTATVSLVVALRVTSPATCELAVGAVNSTLRGVVVPVPVTSTTVSHDALAPELPVTDKVYSVSLVGETRSEPDTGTDPKLVSDARIALVDDQMRSELSPSVMVGESAPRLHEGVVFTLAPPPPPKPGETSVIALGENVGDKLDGAVSCDAVDAPPAPDEFAEEEFCDEFSANAVSMYARVSGPKYPVAGKS